MNQDMRNFFYVASQVQSKIGRKELRLTLPEHKWYMTQKQYLERIRLETNKIENIPSLILQLQKIRTKVNRLTEIANQYIEAIGESHEQFLLYTNTTKDAIVDELMYGDYAFYDEVFTTSISISDWYNQLTYLMNESRSRIDFFREKIAELSKAYSRKVINEVIDVLSFGVDDYSKAILYSLPYSADNNPEDGFVNDTILELHHKGQFLKLVIHKDEIMKKTSYYSRFIAIPGKTKVIYR